MFWETQVPFARSLIWSAGETKESASHRIYCLT